jgi:predicted polyphosphate/ATP-dependent NAD kinase
VVALGFLLGVEEQGRGVSPAAPRAANLVAAPAAYRWTMVCVGVIANPASGRDIRRLVAGASVFGNADKAGMVFRALAGLGAAGVDRALMMPASDGLSATLRRQLQAHAPEHLDGAAPFPSLEELPIRLTGTADDSARAVELMRGAGVAAILVLGGDGTHRVVAKHAREVPLCALSTGTNNAFPELREATVAGLATGLVATGQVGGGMLRREAALEVELSNGERDLALVDVAVSAERFVGARALWRSADVSELLVTFANPSAVGLSAVAGLLQPLARGAGRGLYVALSPTREDAALTLKVPLAPGLVVPVGVNRFRTIELGESIALTPGRGCLALDGEREIECGPDERTIVRLVPGPSTIDIDAVMRSAAAKRLLCFDPTAQQARRE